MGVMNPPKNKFSPTRPFNSAPEIAGEYVEDGQRFYMLKDGRIYNADIYDRNFKVKPVTVKRKGYKGMSHAVDENGVRKSNDLKRKR